MRIDISALERSVEGELNAFVYASLSNRREIMAEAENRRALGQSPEQAIRGLQALTEGGRKPAPVHLWNPPYCGELDMRIARDGTWYYQDSPIGRAPLVKLFASVLRKDPERYVLVTPVERLGLTVEDAPFLGVEMRAEGEGDGATIALRTNVDDWVVVDVEHPLRFERGEAEGLKPYVRVRGDLWALVKRALFYDLVALGETAPHEGREWFGVRSRGLFFPMAPAAEIEGL